MSKINDGGPAFPHPGGASDCTVQESHLGLSLRDYFAGQAMPILLHQATIKDTAKSVALASYAMADAMLKARKATDE